MRSLQCLVVGSRRNKALSAPQQWGGEWMLGYLPVGSLWALLNAQSSHLPSAPCQETSDPSLQDSSVRSSHSPACWRNPQCVHNVNMPQLPTVAVFILWCVDSWSLTNSPGSVGGDKAVFQELSFTYCTRVCTTTTATRKTLSVCNWEV